MEETIWSLPCPSSHIFEGPYLRFLPGSVVLSFDIEELGERSVRFGGVVGFSFTEYNSCVDEHLRAYDKVVEIKDSKMLLELRANSRIQVSDVRHFRIFFDDVGCFDVLAKMFCDES